MMKGKRKERRGSKKKKRGQRKVNKGECWPENLVEVWGSVEVYGTPVVSNLVPNLEGK